LLDRDSNGRISGGEISYLLGNLEKEMSADHLNELVQNHGIHGFNSFQDLLQVLARRLVDRTSEHEIADVLKIFDKTSSGRVPLKSLTRTLLQLRKLLSRPKLKEILLDAQHSEVVLSTILFSKLDGCLTGEEIIDLLQLFTDGGEGRC